MVLYHMITVSGDGISDWLSTGIVLADDSLRD